MTYIERIVSQNVKTKIFFMFQKTKGFMFFFILKIKDYIHSDTCHIFLGPQYVNEDKNHPIFSFVRVRVYLCVCVSVSLSFYV